LPFEYEDGSKIVNSERSMQSWYIENPISKELVKSLTIRLQAKTEKELIVVLKAPTNHFHFNLVSFVTLRLPQNRQNALRRNQSNNISDPNNESGLITEKHLKKRGSEISEIEIEKT
jgi:hypothetical protein